jgi:hypothetical protein
MDKLIKPSQAVLDFSRVEFTYNRATSQKLGRKELDWWISYYQRRIDEIATIHKMDVDDLIVDWLKWRAQVQRQETNAS